MRQRRFAARHCGRLFGVTDMSVVSFRVEAKNVGLTLAFFGVLC